MVDLRTLPVYALGAPSSQAHASLLVPALLIRVLLQNAGSGRDVLLQAVGDLRQAGVTSPRQQADLLQLPVDLTEFLDQQIRDAGSSDERQPKNQVAHLIQCRLTGRVWGTVLARVQPAETQYGDDRWPRRIVHGTAGRPVYERVFVVNTFPTAPPKPTAAVIVAALKDVGAFAGALVVAEPRDILTRVFVSVDAANQPALLDPVNGMVDADLTGRIDQVATRDPRLADWIVAPAEFRQQASQGIAAQLHRLQDLHSAIRGNRLRDSVGLEELRHTARILLATILRRLQRQFSLLHAPVTSLERAHRVAASHPGQGASTLASRAAADDGRSTILRDACDVLIGMSQGQHAEDACAIDPESIVRTALLIEDSEMLLSARLSIPDLENNLQELSEGLEHLAQAAIHLEVVRG
jgi:hypothetical protein